MRTDILMVTFSRDAEFARYALQSIQRFCSGFGGVTIVVPHEDVQLFREMNAPAGTVIHGFHEPPGKGMLAHMACKMESDIWCPDAGAVLNLDADTIFWRDCTPADFFVEGRPILYREKFEGFRHYESRYSWKRCVMDATGIDAEWETMVRHPAVHLAPTYGLSREVITRHTGMDWKDWWMAGENTFPQSRAEFPTLGAVAIKYAPDMYHWVEHADEGRDYVYDRERDFVRSLWSHSGIDGVCERHLGRTAREVIEGILR